MISITELVAELRQRSKQLSKMDENGNHGIMTTLRFEEIDLIGQACLKLLEMEQEIIELKRLLDVEFIK